VKAVEWSVIGGEFDKHRGERWAGATIEERAASAAAALSSSNRIAAGAWRLCHSTE
jgi:hypothetical protein